MKDVEEMVHLLLSVWLFLRLGEHAFVFCVAVAGSHSATVQLISGMQPVDVTFSH